MPVDQISICSRLIKVKSLSSFSDSIESFLFLIMILNNLFIRYEKTLKIPKTMKNNFKGKSCDKITSIREQTK